MGGPTARAFVTLLLIAATVPGCASVEVPAFEGGQASRAGVVSTDGSSIDRPGQDGFAEVIELSGAAEVPGPGAEEAVGSAVVALVGERDEVCVEITVQDLDQPTAAHLHEAGPGASGEVVLALSAPADGEATVDACVSADPEVLQRLGDDLSDFYVNVHSMSFPDGALRGQLH